jgi:hypothetical protein
MHVVIVKFNAFNFFKILIHSFLNFLKRHYFVEKSFVEKSFCRKYFVEKTFVELAFVEKTGSRRCRRRRVRIFEAAAPPPASSITVVEYTV